MSRFLGQVIIASIEYMVLPILHGLPGHKKAEPMYTALQLRHYSNSSIIIPLVSIPIEIPQLVV